MPPESLSLAGCNTNCDDSQKNDPDTSTPDSDSTTEADTDSTGEDSPEGEQQTEAGQPTSFTTSELLIESYIDSSLEIREEVRNGEQGIYFRQEPGIIPHEEAVNAFFANLNAYITDMVEELDLDVKEFKNTSYQRRNSLDVARYQDYDGTGVDMEISVDGLIQDIESQV